MQASSVTTVSTEEGEQPHRFQRVLIVRKPGDPVADKLFDQIHESFVMEEVTTIVDPSVADRCPPDCEIMDVDNPETNRLDLVITLGGDGTLLYVCSLFTEAVPPILSFNVGSLGFLTPFSVDEVEEVLGLVLSGDVDLLERTRLMATVYRNSEAVATFQVMNEIAVDRGYSAFLSQLDCYCDGELMTTVQGDGIIIATATGSTAYNLSAGGSAVHPAIAAMLFTPICPHSLSFRPITLPSDITLRVQVPEQARSTAWASIDGRYRIELNMTDYVDIVTSPYPLRTVCRRGRSGDWFRSLRTCLDWNVRRIQKALPGGFTGRLEPE
ncbi:Inorganic polyphosphate/ATP-NAD kinase [Carpediemonas membranifera]|uniref:Inorganic polyphosphate/ATP-NAD kinase n=1 Tax=Carpediemonas membranifera TaxID=201153 RepID=A0A8J6AWS2_9EUKA|nr:Inorganic polyphosphate/ATP-NAD kinase [Carpediemonas membranifera]|eukprot:KAG9394430.1 Inorganic polyphosphate/ATP-NAD kinase [Carpediemonas membranifera]